MERLLSKRKIVRLSVSNNQNNLQKIFLPRNANGISLRANRSTSQIRQFYSISALSLQNLLILVSWIFS